MTGNSSWTGDINNDNYITLQDAQYILHWLASGGTINNEVTYHVNSQTYKISSQQIMKNDFNSDRQITIHDAQYILNWIAAGGSIQ